MGWEVIWRGKSLEAARFSHLYHVDHSHCESLIFVVNHDHNHYHDYHVQVAGQPGPDSGYVSHDHNHYHDYHDHNHNHYHDYQVCQPLQWWWISKAPGG